jgi:hypothetical protein
MLARVTDRRAAEQDARRLEAVAGSVKTLGDQLRAIAASVASVTGELHDLQRQIELLAALRTEDHDAARRLEQLEQVLDAERVASQVAAATARGDIALDPVPHLVVSNPFPDDVYCALVDATPPAVFFGRDRQELALPLTLAPVASIAAWTFASRIVRTVLAPAILARFEEPVRGLPALEEAFRGGGVAALTPSRGHLALRRPGDTIPRGRRRPGHILTTVVPLVSCEEDVPRLDVVLRLDGDAGDSSRSAASTPIVLPPNSALAFVALSGTLEYASGAVSEDKSGLPTYEFTLSVPGGSRGALAG